MGVLPTLFTFGLCRHRILTKEEFRRAVYSRNALVTVSAIGWRGVASSALLTFTSLSCVDYELKPGSIHKFRRFTRSSGTLCFGTALAQLCS
jgi:hypothetical protein